jgi:hypothetical protein
MRLEIQRAFADHYLSQTGSVNSPSGFKYGAGTLRNHSGM